MDKVEWVHAERVPQVTDLNQDEILSSLNINVTYYLCAAVSLIIP